MNCSPLLKVRFKKRKSWIYKQQFCCELKLLYNWSSLALVSSLVHGALLHEQGWHFGSVSPRDDCKDCKDDYNKELPTTGTWSTIHRVTSPLRHIRRVGWSVCIIHATSPGDICEVTTCHCGIMDQLVEHRLTEPLRIRLSACLCFCL